MASTVCPAAPPPLPTPPPAVTPANKKSGRASSSVSWIKDKIQRASPEFADHALQTHGKNLLRPSSSTARGRASLSKNWTEDKIEREHALQTHSKSLLRPSSAVRGCAPLSKIERTGIGCKRGSATGSEIQRGEKKTRPDEHSAVAYYAGPAFSNSPHPSELSIPFFVKSPDASQILFAVIEVYAATTMCRSTIQLGWLRQRAGYCSLQGHVICQ